MKKFKIRKIVLMFVILIITLTSFSQIANYLPTSNYNDTIITRKGFIVGYNKKLRQANWVIYELTRNEVKTKIAKRTNIFIPDSTYHTATDNDYLRSGYDRGHLAPAADMSYSVQAMGECFSYINMSPQLAILNRGIWKKLEDKVRGWALEDSNIYIVTGGVFQDSMKLLGTSNIPIPKYFYKIILDLNAPYKAIAFVIPNGEITKSLYNYTTTIDSVEKITNIKFFSQLPDSIKNELDHEKNPTAWGLTQIEVKRKYYHQHKKDR